MGQILEAGMAAVRDGEQRQAFVNEAASRFEALGIPEATQLGQLTREHPEAAHAWAEQNGGWGNLYNMMRADAGRRQLGDAMTRLQGTNATQREVLQQLVPIAVQFGVGAEQLGQIAKAYGTPDPQAFDWEHADPGKFTPESYAAGWQRRDPTLLRSARPAVPPSLAEWATSASIKRYEVSGDPADLERRPPDRAPAERQPPSGYRYLSDGSLEAIPGGPATRDNSLPAGFRWNPDGTMQAIPGGPGDPLHGLGNSGAGAAASSSGSGGGNASTQSTANDFRTRHGLGSLQPKPAGDLPTAKVAPAADPLEWTAGQILSNAKRRISQGGNRKQIEDWVASMGVNPGLLSAGPSLAKSGRATAPVSGAETPREALDLLGPSALLQILRK